MGAPCVVAAVAAVKLGWKPAMKLAKQLAKKYWKTTGESARKKIGQEARDKKVLDKLKLKMGKHYDFGVGKGATFILELDKKYEDNVLELLINNRINVRGA